MLDDMSATQFEDWIAYYKCDPWGEERDDMRMARIVWAILQSRSEKTIDESIFMLKFSAASQPKPLTADEYRAKSMKAYAMHGGFHKKA